MTHVLKRLRLQLRVIDKSARTELLKSYSTKKRIKLFSQYRAGNDNDEFREHLSNICLLIFVFVVVDHETDLILQTQLNSVN